MRLFIRLPVVDLLTNLLNNAIHRNRTGVCFHIQCIVTPDHVGLGNALPVETGFDVK
jgi:hypothetical protein